MMIFTPELVNSRMRETYNVCVVRAIKAHSTQTEDTRHNNTTTQDTGYLYKNYLNLKIPEST